MHLPSPIKRKARRLPLVLILLCGWQAQALDACAGLDHLSRRAWLTEQGLPQNTIHSIAQTGDGYIWVATEEGLARFDGIGFAVFDKQNTQQLKSNDIRALLHAKKADALWVSTSVGLTRFSNGVWTTFTTAQGLASDDVVSAYEDSEGVIWIATSSGLSRFKEGAFTSYTTRDGLAGDSVQSVFQDREGALWVGTGEGLSRFRDGRFTSFAESDGLPSNNVVAIEQGANGCLWLGTDAGLACYMDGRFRNFTVGDGLPNARVISLRADGSGSLWVGTAGGLARLRDGRFEILGDAEGLTNGIVLSVFEDREGSLWIGTESGGLHQLRDKKFTTYTARDGLAHDIVKAIYGDRKGNVWIGTYGGGLSLLKDGKFTTYTTTDGLASNIILALIGDAEGNLWIGTPDGLTRLRDGRFNTFTSAEGLPNDFVRSIYADRAGRLWVGTRGGLARLEGGVFKTYTTADGLPNNFVGTIYEDAGGDIWVGTLGGLSRLTGGRIINYTTKDGLSDDVVISIHGDAEGRMWISTNGGGLSLLKDGKFTTFTTRDGLPHDTIYRILEDAQGRLWMSCNKGIFRLPKSELEEFAAGRRRSLSPVLYGTADGMATRECSGGGHPSGWKGADGRLWFSTIKGVAMIDPESVATNTQPPPVVVQQVRVDGEPVAPGPAIELPPGRSRFDFYFAGLSFVAPEKVRYRYMLEGFDPDWVDGGDQRVAYYTNLGPGDYRFLIAACNNDGVWSDAPASFAFRLQPHFYRTYWFYALCAAGLVLLAGQLYALRVRHMRARFAAVLGERNRIARELHDNLAQEILGISVQLEIVARLMPAPSSGARTHLDRARSLVRSSIAEARRYVWDLRSQSLDDKDLPTAFTEMTRRLASESSARTQFEVSGTFRPLPRQVENNLLRIGQEAINNAVRHAGARTISVRLDFETGAVRLSVRDDGRGFDSHANGDGHFGLVGMRERAAEMGGVVTINSEAGTGSEVLVSVPIKG